MITEREKKALQPAKKVFGLFTQDVLLVARKIIIKPIKYGTKPN